MSPRRYKMDGRQERALETRRRIVESTLTLHSRKGILGTSWQDIATHADVSVGTVYKHFPSLETLLPACGGLMGELFRPPSPDDAAAIAAMAPHANERLQQAVFDIFSFYHRAGPAAEIDSREREIEAVRGWEAYWQQTIETFVREALAPLLPDENAVQIVSALLDQKTFAAFAARGVSLDAAVSEVSRMVMIWLEHRPPAKRLQSTKGGMT